ncbi:DUF6494 family protein [Ferrimonas gelatinilytica]|uniref:Uncharacterized protein n=1 Tax=Ferrimonas gelatinilytica TaxID=1255257 RepID=A0ABP9S658_9GAMM
MDREQRDGAIRRFLKQVGIQSHQELEQLLIDAEAEGKLGAEPLQVEMTLSVPQLEFEHKIQGKIGR